MAPAVGVATARTASDEAARQAEAELGDLGHDLALATLFLLAGHVPVAIASEGPPLPSPEVTYFRLVPVPDLDRPWDMSDPRRDRTLHPYTDAGTVAVIDQAVTTLVLLRSPMWLGDPGPTISVLVSLAAEADSRLYDAVADAADQGYSWDQVAFRLDASVATARRRYGPYSRWRRTDEGRLVRWGSK